MNRRRYIAAAAAAMSLPGWGADQVRIGLTPVILADQAAFLSRWSRYLGVRIGVDVAFVARESYQSVLDLLFSNQVDAAWICGYPYIRFEPDLSLLAVPLYMGKPVYQAYLIRSNAAPLINGWSDLKHKAFAYSDPLSNSGWLVAQAQLAKAGVMPRELKRAFFAHSHRNVAEAVAAGLAHAGSIDGYVWETMRLQKMSAVAKTEVVWKSAAFGFPPLVTRRRSPPAVTASLRHALLGMANDDVGQDLLASLNLSGFTAGSLTLFESIRSQAQLVPSSGVVG